MKSIKDELKKKAYELGFNYCGFSQAGFLEDEAPKLENWLKNDFHGKMGYMENHFDKRLNPTLLFDDTKTVISLIINYHSDNKQKDPKAPKISKYAYGEDYHQVIRRKLTLLVDFMHEKIGDVSTKICIDSAPVMDKAWAKRAGAGWIGKNSNLIRPGFGSFFFIAEILVDYTFEYDGPMKDYCGTCTRCIDECPTQAIVQPYVVDSKKCISYLTIELKDELLPSAFKGKMDNWIFGCDVCQDVCPWNRFSTEHDISEFKPRPGLLEMTYEEWNEMTQETFTKLFKNSAVKRTKYKGLKRNINFLKNKDT